MLLVVDANIVFSALVAKGRAVDIFMWNAISRKLDLFAPEFLSEEIERKALEIMKKSRLTKHDLDVSINMIESQIRFIPVDEFSEFLPDAVKVSPPNDFPYVALAMKFKRDGSDVSIWSNDKDFKKQSSVIVLSTHELVEIIKTMKFQ